MNEDDDKISASVVNDPHQQTTSGIVGACHRRNLIRLLRRSRSPPTSMPAEPLQVDTNESGAEEQPQQLLSVAFKQHHNHHDAKTLQTAKNNLAGNTDTPPPTTVCNMCCRKDEICVNLQNSHATVLTVSDLTRLPSWDIRQILAAVCSRCLVYIGAITESSSKLRMRCEQAMHNQSVVLAPPTPDTSPNNFLQVTTTLLDDTADHSNNVQQQRNCYAPGYCDDAANDLTVPLATSASPPPAPPSPSQALPNLLTNQTLNAISRSPTPTNVANNSMLRIHYERPVSPLNTESGGGGKSNKRSYQRVQVIPVQMICTHCNRAYWRKDYYRKHMRRCSAKYRYAKSMMPARTRSVSRLEFDAISLVSEDNERLTSSQPQPRTYRCNICTVTVESVAKLRQHKRIHLPRYYCDICSGEFTSQNEYDFHRVECLAKKEVFDKGLENIRNDAKSPELKPARRTTRSYSRAASVAALSVSSSKPETVKKVKTGKRGVSSTKKSQTEQTTKPNDDGHSTITNYVKRNKHLYTKRSDSESNKTTLQHNKKKHNEEQHPTAEEDEEDDEEEEDDDDDVSQADTLYSKRLSFTNHWVEEHSISSHSHLSQSDNYIDEYMEDIPFRTLKEYDLYLLERLKIEVRLNSLTCFVPDCKFTCATLNEMMVHDYIYHYKKPWFYCHKCGYCFTSKVFLDYHLDLQNKGRYVCYKCGGHFEYQHQLDRHLIQHNRLSRNGSEKYICHYCNFIFLDEDKLLKHCHYENHLWNSQKHTIEIDHTMTISNKVPPPPSKNNTKSKNKKYQVKILNMVLQQMPTKRCTPMEKYRLHLPPHLRMPNRIGQVEFRYPSNPNCVGCL